MGRPRSLSASASRHQWMEGRGDGGKVGERGCAFEAGDVAESCRHRSSRSAAVLWDRCSSGFARNRDAGEFGVSVSSPISAQVLLLECSRSRGSDEDRHHGCAHHAASSTGSRGHCRLPPWSAITSGQARSGV